jgi:hypothetical protein
MLPFEATYSEQVEMPLNETYIEYGTDIDGSAP